MSLFLKSNLIFFVFTSIFFSQTDLLNEIDAMIDLTVIGLGKRLSRFSMIIDNGLVNAIFDEEGGGLDKSKAENVLKFL